MLRLVLLFCALAAALAPSVAAQERHLIALGTVEGGVWSPMPAFLDRGWAPVQIALRNNGTDEQTVSINLRTRYANRMARSSQRTSVKLAAGESWNTQLYVPCDRIHGEQSIGCLFTVGDERDDISLALAGEAKPSAGRVIAVLRGKDLPHPEFATIGAALPTGTEFDVRGVGAHMMPPGLSRTSPAMRASGSRGLGFWSGGAVLFRIAPVQLPDRAMGWSGVDTLVCDTTDPLRPDVRWKHVAEWVQQGGQVALVGPDAAAVAAKLPGIKELLDERMAVTRDADAPGNRVFRAGFGLLAVYPGAAAGQFLGTPNDWQDVLEPLDDALPPIEVGGHHHQPSAIGAMYRDIGHWLDPLEKKTLPIRLVLAFLILFAIVVGPLNVAFTRRRKRPDLLFLTVPALSIVATFLLLAFGIAREGFSLKGNANSLAILDQRPDGDVTTIMRRELFVGRGGFALEPMPGTTVLAFDRGDDSDRRSVTDDGNAMKLGGAFLPAREQSQHMSLRTAPARVRVQITQAADGGFEAVNGLGVDIDALELRALDGRWFATKGGIASGAKGILAPAPSPRLTAELATTGDPLFAFSEPPLGGYIAIVDASPTADDLGIPMKELSSKHAVMGVLSADPKEWSR